MEYPRTFPHMMPSESQSRQLDFTVRAQEMPYGYDVPPPPADSGDYNMRPRESHKDYGKRAKHG